MAGAAKILEKAQASATNVRFSELVKLIEAMEYTRDRIRGSHHIYRRTGYPPINVQEDGGKAKAYQVRQVLDIIDRYKIEV